MRMAVFRKTSRFAFHIVHEVKSSVRLGENAYANNGALQPHAMERTALALGEFLSVAKSFDARKILCVATSALRDAPNKNEFLSRIRQDHGLSIKVIEGEKEAYLGGMACANLLPSFEYAVTVDVGGGSTELAFLSGNKVERLLSINLGTVRIKELFLDRGDYNGAISYIDNALKEVLQEIDPVPTVIGIGGTFRALTRALMKKESYPLRKLHGYTTSAERFNAFCGSVIGATSEKKLKNLNIKPDRFDTIKAGALILHRTITMLQAKETICSGVGVREGVYLSDLLRNSADRFPSNFNPSVRYLLDSYGIYSDHGTQCARLSKRMFELMQKPLGLDPSYAPVMAIASKLISIGSHLRYYAYQRHSHYLALNGLDFGLTHPQIALISHLLLFKKGATSSALLPKGEYASLLPETDVLNALYSLLWLSHILLARRQNASDITLTYDNGELSISGKGLYLAREQLKNVPLPKNMTITLTEV